MPPRPRRRPPLTGLALASVAAAAVIACAGCRRAEQTIAAVPAENVVLITIDTLRADHVGVCGGRATTPVLDRLAAGGTVFDRCISQTPLTLPSHTTILSGTYPPHHGIRDNGGFVVPGELELISETLQGRGFATGAFVGAYVLHSKWGLNQGFDTYSDSFDRGRYGQLLLQNSKRADEVLGDAMAWIDDSRDRRFFAWIHLFDPHTPYDPPPPFNSDPDALYRGEVEYTDHAIGGLVEYLDESGLMDETLVVVAADHGEGLGEHGEAEHGFFIYESTVHVPLIVRPPSPAARGSWDGLVELADIAPTILEGLGVIRPPSIQGRSLWPVVAGLPVDRRQTAFTETFYPKLHFGWSELRGLYRDGYKYVEAPRPELFDLSADAAEEIDLADSESLAEVLAANRSALRARLRDLSDGALDPTATITTVEDRAALEALGYLTSTVTTDSAVPPADPKDKIQVFTRLTEAAALVTGGQPEAAIAIARSAIEADPHLVDAHVVLGNALRATGRLDEAASRYRHVLDLKPDSNFAMIDLMGVLIDADKSAEAIEQGQRFLAVFPDDAILHELQGAACSAAGDHAAALHHFERSLALRPDASIQLRAGEIHLLEGRGLEAAAAARRALDLDPSIAGAHFLLGRVADAEGRTGDALAQFRNEINRHPSAYMAAFNAALISAQRGDREEAVRYCRLAIASEPPFGLPYFMIAADYLDRGSHLGEGVELCRRGILAAPDDPRTLVGYQTLLRLLAKTGDDQAYRRTLAEAEEFQRRVQQTQQ